jgi:crotonobetainyl-CoA:carnitine CoA-transferase CaiB-like acyl-CoA transferase
VFSARTADEWETNLLAAGVGCVRADAASNFNFLYEDPQARAINMMTATEHPDFGGKYWRHAPVLRFSKTPCQARPFTGKGEHTRSILAELGYDDDEIARLKEQHVVNWPD